MARLETHSLQNQPRFFELTLCYFVFEVTSNRIFSTKAYLLPSQQTVGAPERLLERYI